MQEREKLYGLKQEDYVKLRNAQNNKCAICLEEQYKFHVDHDHSTNRVRALLCSKCNTGLGMFREDPKLLQSAITYLLEHQLVSAQANA